MSDEQREFLKRAADAIHEIAFIGAKLGIPADSITAQRVREKVVEKLAVAATASAFAAERERLKHDVASLRTTNETLADRVARLDAENAALREQITRTSHSFPVVL